jgi:hypothetical protein
MYSGPPCPHSVAIALLFVYNKLFIPVELFAKKESIFLSPTAFRIRTPSSVMIAGTKVFNSPLSDKE